MADGRDYTEQVFRTTYKDDYSDSAGYHRILFNSGRALQARELTQLQTIIQKEVARFGGNVFKDGAMVQPGGMSVNAQFEFIKIAGNDTVFDTVADLAGVVLTGAVSGIKVRVLQAVAAEGTDPDTLFVQYVDQPDSTAKISPSVTVGERLSNGSDINLDVQSTNTSENPATGQGLLFEIADGSFFVQGHFVFCPKQKLIISKYDNLTNTTVGFKVVQDIVGVGEGFTDLYDNQGATPNTSSPGADRFRIRLILIDQEDLAEGDNFVYAATIRNGKITTTANGSSSLNSVNSFVATRIKEINGNFIKEYFRTYFEPNDATTLNLKVEPGTAYINGNRVNKNEVNSLRIPKAQETFVQNGDQVSIDYGAFYEWDSGQGMLDFDTCEQVQLKTGFGGTGTTIATANIRAIKEGRQGKYNAYLFNIKNSDVSFSLREVKSIKSAANTDLVEVVQTGGISVFHEANKKGLLFDTPIARPKLFSDITVTYSARQFFQASGSTHTLTLTDTGETYVNEGDVIISDPASAIHATATANIQAGSKSIQFANLTNGVVYQVLVYIRKTNSTVRPKTLVSGGSTVTVALDSDGSGNKYIPLGKSDIYRVSRICKEDSGGENIFSNFILDAGARESHYDDGRLLYIGAGLDSATQKVFARFDYFGHEAGQFYAVNSYVGSVEDLKVPAQRLDNGSMVSLRDVIDFRPATGGNGSATFATVSGLPQPTDTVIADAEYYLPRNDKLVLSKDGELRYLTGTSSLDPKFPNTPLDCIDLYKYQLNANTLHTKDLKSTLIPMKGYTMSDINKLEKRLDRVEEMTTLSLLELSTKNMSVLDSSGADRTKSGFFVDNFANQMYTDTKNPEHRASMDPRKKLIRPMFKESTVDLYYDSANSSQLGTKKMGDIVTLDFSEVAHLSQEVMSRTENLNPFFIGKQRGVIQLSPSSDYWKNSEKAAPRIIDGGTELDTRQALLWNNWEWNWNGTDIDDLQVGNATNSNVSGTSTSHTQNTLEPRLTGQIVTETVGDWVEVGSQSTTSTLSSQDVVVSSDTEEVTRTMMVPNGPTDGQGWSSESWTSTIQTDVVERRDTNETIDTTTYDQTTTIKTENEYTTTTEYTTNVSTANTVNRIASESTVRELIGSRVIDVALIPWMRSRTIAFKAEALRPNTQYFPFFDGTDVSNFCREETFKSHSERLEGISRSGSEGILAGEMTPTTAHGSGKTTLTSDTTGKIEGTFEIPDNSAMRFRTGQREFALYDISAYSADDAISTAVAYYTAKGELETVQDDVTSTRILQVVGSTTTSTSSTITKSQTISTEALITESVATDVVTESTISESVGDRTTNTTRIGQPVETDRNGNPIIRNGRGGENTDDEDPLAQTFSLENDPNGIFVTRVRCYFKEKDDEGLPVIMELRPTVNGVPDSNKIIGRVVLDATAVNTSAGANVADVLANGTDFVLQEPIFLSGERDYAVVLRSNSMKYLAYISQVEDFVLGSTESRISKQPTLGSLFKSQNSKLWEPDQTQDLAFKLFRADFVTKGNAILENVIVSPKVMTRNPFMMDSGSNIVTVINRGHGLRTGDKTHIRTMSLDSAQPGVDSATVFGNGLTGANIIGQHTVIDFDGSGYTFQAGASSTKNLRFGGGQCTTSTNLVFDTLRPTLELLQPETTNVTLSGKFTSTSSLAGTETRFSKDTKFNLIPNKKDMTFQYPKAVYSHLNEVRSGGMNGTKSATLQVSLTTTDSRVSPIIDLQRCGLVAISNMIDKQASSATTGFNVPLTYVAETDISNGSALAKHITVPTTLAEDAVGLKIILAANKPPSASFKIYYRTCGEDKALGQQAWILAESENTNPPDANKQIFREYRYIVGGEGGDMSPFTKFQAKLVMESTNSAQVPVFRDLRVIALAV